MKLREARDLPIESIPCIGPDRVRIRWASSYWDGPLEGLAILDGREVWFSFADDSCDPKSTWSRRFWLVQLTPEQLSLELEQHAEFQRYVGTHFDYDNDGRRNIYAQRPISEHSKFFAKYGALDRSPGDLSENEVIGWFTW